MAGQREYPEMVARAVSLMVFYHVVGPHTRTPITPDVRALAAWADKEGVDGRKFVEDVGAQLLVRYGPELAPRLTAYFSRAFRGDEASRPS